MPYEPDPETAIRVGWTATLLGLLIFAVSAVGEYLGWWNAIGEVGMVAGTALSVVAGFGTWFSGASSGQLSAVGREVRGVRTVVEDNGTRLASMDDKLGDLDKLEELDRLEKLDELENLDEIEARLDAQTGVLGQQLSVLGEIRDAI